MFSAPNLININAVSKIKEDKNARSLSFFILIKLLYKNITVNIEHNTLGILKIVSDLLCVINIVKAVNQVGRGGFSKRSCPFKVVVHQSEFCNISLALIKFLASIISTSFTHITDKNAKSERLIKINISFLLENICFSS